MSSPTIHETKSIPPSPGPPPNRPLPELPTPKVAAEPKKNFRPVIKATEMWAALGAMKFPEYDEY